jgi:hypothetical protein
MRRFIVSWAVAFVVTVVLVYGLTTDWHFGTYCPSEDFCWSDPGLAAPALFSAILSAAVLLAMAGLSRARRA